MKILIKNFPTQMLYELQDIKKGINPEDYTYPGSNIICMGLHLEYIKVQVNSSTQSRCEICDLIDEPMDICSRVYCTSTLIPKIQRSKQFKE